MPAACWSVYDRPTGTWLAAFAEPTAARQWVRSRPRPKRLEIVQEYLPEPPPEGEPCSLPPSP